MLGFNALVFLGSLYVREPQVGSPARRNAARAGKIAEPVAMLEYDHVGGATVGKVLALQWRASRHARAHSAAARRAGVQDAYRASRCSSVSLRACCLSAAAARIAGVQEARCFSFCFSRCSGVLGLSGRRLWRCSSMVAHLQFDGS